MIKDIKNKSKATIIGVSNAGEEIPAAAGRISTQEGTASEILARSKDSAKNARLISKVTGSGHNSVIEHTVFNIAFENVSVFAEQFIIEFRLASFTVKSRRYVDFASSGYYTPDFMDFPITNDYKILMDSLFEEYEYFCTNGIPKEDARFLLPYSLCSNFYCTLNARELLHMLKSMLFGRGSIFPELKDLGGELFSQMKALTPGICADFYERNSSFDNSLDFLSMFESEEQTGEPGERVELLSYTQNAAEIVAKTALAAQTQYAAPDIENIVGDKGNVSKIIEALIKNSRPRALENAVFTFRVNGVSLSTVTHFTRHRMQSLDVPLLTKIDIRKYILPPSIEANSALCERYHAAFERAARVYEKMKALGVPEESLVYCRLSGNALDIVSTMNARELLLFFRLRTCTRAQWEIRDYAFLMLKKCREVCSEIFNHYGPGCYVSKCPEGAMSCGHAGEMREKYKIES